MNSLRNKTYVALAEKASKIKPQEGDQVIATVYQDVTTSGRVITRGEIVVPGGNTLQAYPSTKDFPFHFRKTFTPESGPIKREETPAVEFSKTSVIQRLLPGKIPTPLGFDTWTYRSEAICGRTLQALSPFSNLSYEDSLHLKPNLVQLKSYAQIALIICETLEELHSKGHCHGDLTLHNAMCLSGERQKLPILIDLAGSANLNALSESQQASAKDDDFQELYRDLALVQYFLGEMDNPHSRKSLALVNDLFPSEIACIINRLPGNQNESELS